MNRRGMLAGVLGLAGMASPLARAIADQPLQSQCVDDAAIRGSLEGGDGTVVHLLSDAREWAPLEYFHRTPIEVLATLEGVGRTSPKPVCIPNMCLLVQNSVGNTLIDAGSIGLNDQNMGRVQSQLAALGLKSDDINRILLTHLHREQAGGLLNRDGSAVYSKAELIASKAEWEFWLDESNSSKVPIFSLGAFSLARKLAAAYGDRIRKVEGQSLVCAGIEIVPLPGHTAGHSLYKIDCLPKTVLFLGDAFYFPFQLNHPDWVFSLDNDQDGAVASRAMILKSLRNPDWLLSGTRLMGFNRIVFDREGVPSLVGIK